ncbi:hypothetical protein BSZ39_03310 [Bowdeniella nasicola]|uniref:Uncharacterized protein n=1 Tax=Bowdeniella nasicola TaxID=208480 RepID=A0A1Q5Q4F5_9ACTO|nr:methyltransferase [Bowdeniella nasicola]OKL54569.1 hypothetical protein BSZ39_03310 [Bowdeniella nasicola]
MTFASGPAREPELMPPPSFARSEQASRLRADLTEFSSESLDSLLSPLAVAALAREELAPARRELAADERPLALLARLFLLGQELTAAQVAAALPQFGLADALACHLVGQVPSDTSATDAAATDASATVPTPSVEPRYHSLVDLSPTGDDTPGAPAWIMSDLPETVVGGPLPSWHVLGIGGASQTLHALLPREADLGRVLDLGTGSGIQALSLAPYTDAVVATDLSERALAFARANAQLNGVDETRLEVRAGSLFEPVAGERFDVIASNPPFVITPAAAYDAGLPVMEYRDGGMRESGDGLGRRVVSQLGEHLAPGGRAVLLANWEVTGEEPFAAPLAWVAEAEARSGVALDAWIVRREFQDAAEYAEMWLRDGGHAVGPDRQLREATYLAYLEDFASRDVRWIDFGYLLVARPDADLPAGEGMRETTDLTGLAAPSGEDLWRLFARRRRLARASDDAIAAATIQTSDDVTIEHHYRVGASQPEVITATQGGGLHQVISCPTELAGMLSASDGTLTVAQIAGALAALLEVDETEMLAACIAHARRLASIGMVALNFHAEG